MNKRVIVCTILALVVIFTSYIKVYSFSVEDIDGTSTNPDSAIVKVDKMSQGIIKVISTVGSIVSVIILVALGIKYMMGSVEEKAEYKKTLFPYVIGASLLFAASTIASIIYNLAKNV